MPMYNLLEYTSDYFDTTYFNEAANFDADILSNSFRSFKYKTKLMGDTEADGANRILRNATVGVPLKYHSNFDDHSKFLQLIAKWN